MVGDQGKSADPCLKAREPPWDVGTEGEHRTPGRQRAVAVLVELDGDPIGDVHVELAVTTAHEQPSAEDWRQALWADPPAAKAVADSGLAASTGSGKGTRRPSGRTTPLWRHRPMRERSTPNSSAASAVPNRSSSRPTAHSVDLE